MQINNRSIQDMHIFGDPLRNPVILVERVMNAQFRTRSGNSFFSPLEHSANILMGTRLNTGNKLSGTGTPRSSRILRIVVFVHGFQACIFYSDRLLTCFGMEEYVFLFDKFIVNVSTL